MDFQESKKKIYEYYRNQEEDFCRMYSVKSRRYKQKRRLDVIRKIIVNLNLFGGRVLDVGSGDGYATAYILREADYNSYVGLDLSSPKLHVVSRKIKKSSVIVGDAEVIPFQNDSFDCALCFETLEHLLHPWIALGEIKRVLKSGGLCFVSIPIDGYVQEKLLMLVGKIKPSKNRHFNEHIQIFTWSKIKENILSNGFNILYRQFCVFNFPLLNILLQRIPYQWWAKLDDKLAKLPFGMIGIGTWFNFTFGNEYLILVLKKIGNG